MRWLTSPDFWCGAAAVLFVLWLVWWTQKWSGRMADASIRWSEDYHRRKALRDRIRRGIHEQLTLPPAEADANAIRRDWEAVIGKWE